MIGKILGNRYELLEKIGSGGMAVVYKAKCHLLNRFVAVKVLREEYVTDQDFLKKFSKEAQSAAGLSHQNIVNVYDVGNEDSIPYIVMEYVEGLTLKEYIDSHNGFLKNEQITNFSRQIAKALEHAHGNQIIHRDIKPHNILVSKDGTLKVGDFGIASAISETTTSYSSEAIGSVKYTSPEQARGRNVDQRTDLYALGILMYEMATGQVPFQGETAVEIALKHMKDDVAPPTKINSTLHKGIESIVMRSLLKDISQRYQTANELLVDLEKVIENPNADAAFYDFDTESTQKMPKLNDYDVAEEGETRKMKKPIAKSKTKKSSALKLPNKNILAIIGVVVLAFITALVIFAVSRLAVDGREKAPDFIYLENVVGMTYEDGKALLEEMQYTVEIKAYKKDNEIPEGSIYDQYPKAGTKLRPGHHIKLFISEGATLDQVPNFTNKPFDEVRVDIENTTFQIGVVDYENNDLPNGYVLSQSIKSGTSIKNDAIIDFVVSMGPESNFVIMPLLTDLSLEDAQRTLITMGLEAGELEREYHETIELDRIISQVIAEGEEVELGSLVDLTVSLGKEDEEEEEEDNDPNAIRSKAYNIPTDTYTGQSIQIKLTYEKAGNTSVLYEQNHNITDETPSVLVEVKGSGNGVVNFFINGVLISSRSVDFSK